MALEDEMGFSARRLRVFVAASGVAALSLVVVAPAAQAETVRVFVDCASDVSFFAEVGDTILFEFADNATCDLNTPNAQGIYNITENDPYPGFLSTTMSPIRGTGDQSNNWYAYAYDHPVMTTTLHGESANGPETYSLTPNATVSWIMINDDSGTYRIRWLGPPPKNPLPVRTLGLHLGYGSCVIPTSMQGDDGSWLKLPTSEQCQNGQRLLLGWATSPDFPVRVAQAQHAVDDVIGGMRMIFIPEGGHTLLSGDNNLYAIWSA